MTDSLPWKRVYPPTQKEKEESLGRQPINEVDQTKVDVRAQ